MHVWYHKKDNVILFKMIPWLFHQGKGSISKYGTRSQLKSCKMNTMQWSLRVHKEQCSFVWSYVFCSQLVSSSATWGCGARRRYRAHWGRPCDTEPWSCHWNQWTLMKPKIPVTISMKIYANQAPATSFFMPFLVLSRSVFVLSRSIFRSVNWLTTESSLALTWGGEVSEHLFYVLHKRLQLQWEFCEIKWLRVLFLNAHTSLFVCLFVVCLLTLHTFVWIHVNVNVRMQSNERDIGKLFHQHRNKIEWLTQLGSFCSFSSLNLTPHFKALHLHVSHNLKSRVPFTENLTIFLMIPNMRRLLLR